MPRSCKASVTMNEIPRTRPPRACLVHERDCPHRGRTLSCESSTAEWITSLGRRTSRVVIAYDEQPSESWCIRISSSGITSGRCRDGDWLRPSRWPHESNRQRETELKADLIYNHPDSSSDTLLLYIRNSSSATCIYRHHS